MTPNDTVTVSRADLEALYLCLQTGEQSCDLSTFHALMERIRAILAAKPSPAAPDAIIKAVAKARALASDAACQFDRAAPQPEAPGPDIATLKLELGIHRAVSAAVCKLLDRDKWSAQDFADYVKGLSGPGKDADWRHAHYLVAQIEKVHGPIAISHRIEGWLAYGESAANLCERQPTLMFALRSAAKGEMR